MALTLDTRIPLAAVDQNFDPSKSFNTGVESALRQKQMLLSNRLEQMKADYEAQKLEKAAKVAAQMDAYRAAMAKGQPPQYGPSTPATPPQYNFGGPSPSKQTTPDAGFNIADMLTGRIDPSQAASILTQQPAVTPGTPAIPGAEISPAVPGREPTPDEYMQQLAKAQIGVGDVAGGIDSYKAYADYLKAVRPPNDGHAAPVGGIISIANPAFPDTGEAATVSYNPATNKSEVHPLGIRYTKDDVALGRLAFNQMKWNSDAAYRKARAEKAAFEVGKLSADAQGASPETVDTMARILRAGGTVAWGRGGMSSAIGQQVLARFHQIADEEGVSANDAVARAQLAKAGQSALAKFKTSVEFVEKAAKQADEHLKVAEKALDKLPNVFGGKIPLLNSAVNTLDQMAGNPDAIAAAKALQSFTTEYEKVLTGAYGAQGVSVYGQRDAKTLLNTSMSPGQREAIISNMREDMRVAAIAARKSLDRQANELSNLRGGGGDIGGSEVAPEGGNHPATGKPPAPAATPAYKTAADKAAAQKDYDEARKLAPYRGLTKSEIKAMNDKARAKGLVVQE